MGVYFVIAHLKQFARDESGATAIEYSLILALIAMAAVAAMPGLGQSISNMFTTVSGDIAGVVAYIK
jgi:pilus assembly protein Flp/PilA